MLLNGYRKYIPVHSISLKGAVLIFFIRLLYSIRKILGFKQWQYLEPTHHEDPLHMKTKDALYLGYKYYYKALIQPEENSNLKEYFAKQDLRITAPSNFTITNKITLSIGGDLIPYTCIRPGACKNLWKNVGNYFFDADIVFANLESPADFTKLYSAAPEVMLNDMYFNIDEATFNIFNGNNNYKGYDVLSIANNHSLDMGIEGLHNTMKMLQQKNIAYCGGATTENKKNNIPVIERNTIKTAFIAATFSFNKEMLPEEKKWVCNHINLNTTNADISILKEQATIAKEKGADVVVASLHMGCAYQAYPNMHTVNNIHTICDEAAIDIIIASHPHHPQPLEIYYSPITQKKHFIIYSCGDFIAYDIFKWGHLTMLLKFEISKGILNGKPFTTITDIKIKPAYMHGNIERGEVVSLELLDYLQVKQKPNNYFAKDKDKKMFEEVSSFFDEFVVTENSKHLLQ